MSEPYNRFTGQSLEHLTALSDGRFAVAMTLLVLDLRVPVSTAGSVYSEHGLGEALLRTASVAALAIVQLYFIVSPSLSRIRGMLDVDRPGG
jgi:uncharacterized membrane protein